MEKNARTLIALAVLVFVASLILCVSNMEPAHSGVKRGNVTTNTPQAIDGAVRMVMEEMPPITATTFTSAAGSVQTGLKLPYNYGSTDRYVVSVTNGSSMTDYSMFAVKVTGDSIRIDRAVTTAETYHVVTFPAGTWGK